MDEVNDFPAELFWYIGAWLCCFFLSSSFSVVSVCVRGMICWGCVTVCARTQNIRAVPSPRLAAHSHAYIHTHTNHTHTVLPPIILQQASSLQRQAFFNNLLPILVYGVLGTLVTFGESVSEDGSKGESG